MNIRNNFYTANQIASFTTDAVLKEVDEYKKDPNCWPDLWASGSNLSENEQIAFIYLCLQK